MFYLAPALHDVDFKLLRANFLLQLGLLQRVRQLRLRPLHRGTGEVGY